MPVWNIGDQVKVVSRKVTEEDRKKNRYFEHMAGLRGVVMGTYSDETVAVKVEPESMSEVTKEVQSTAVQRMRERFARETSDEQKKALTKEELDFDANYVLLVRDVDLEVA